MTILETRAAPVMSLDELARCSGEALGSPAWWASLTGDLDDLAQWLVAADTEGLAAQIIADTPHNAAPAKALTTADIRLRGDVLQLRRRVAELHASRAAAPGICGDVLDLVRRARMLDLRSRHLLVEAYGRDLGGE
jgi:hypothetical protein